MASVPLIDVCGASYRAGETNILSDVSWRIEAGQHWAVLGPNGSGKTTLLGLACGYLWPNAGGEVCRQGKRLVDLRELRKSIGWVTSILSERIPGDEPVLDTIVSGKFAQTRLQTVGSERPTEEDYERARELLAEFHFDSLASKRFGVLSQGEQQIVLIARARMTRPLLIVLDEPCAGLDPASRETMLAALQRLAERERSACFVMVTHHVEEIMPVFDSVLVMRDGRVFRRGATGDLITPELIAELYGVAPPELIRRHGRLWPVW